MIRESCLDRNEDRRIGISWLKRHRHRDSLLSSAIVIRFMAFSRTLGLRGKKRVERRKMRNRGTRKRGIPCWRRVAFSLGARVRGGCSFVTAGRRPRIYPCLNNLKKQGWPPPALEEERRDFLVARGWIEKNQSWQGFWREEVEREFLPLIANKLQFFSSRRSSWKFQREGKKRQVSTSIIPRR